MTNSPALKVSDIWTADDVYYIMNDARATMHDVTLRVNSDGTVVRPLGHWEAMRLAQRAIVMSART